MSRYSVMSLATMAALALTACGGSAEKAAGAGESAEASGAPASFDATDACALLDKGIVSAALGSPVTATELSSVTQPTETSAGFSNCTYTLADGRKPQFFTRWSPIDDGDPEGIARTRAGIAELAPQPPVDVPEVGGSAFWVGGMNQLHIFPAKDRYVFFTLMGEEAAKAKADAIALAKKAGY